MRSRFRPSLMSTLPLMWLRLRTLLLAAPLFASAGCVYLPRFDHAVVTRAVPPSPQSRLGRLLAPESHSRSRASLLDSSEQALRSRLYLIDAAQAGIDLQYFIVQNDATGILFVERLLRAADRGVRIRALLDDIHINGLVDKLQALDEHPNVEIRIFNPFSVQFRFPLAVIRFAEMAIDGGRLNHRMHNKLFVADNQVAILGGRNIGDEYFGRGDEHNFIDTDVLLSGPIVRELSAGFDSYWNSQWVYPVTALADFSLFPVDLASVRERIGKRLDERSELSVYRQEIALDRSIDRLVSAESTDWSRVVIDDPDVSWFQRPDEIAQDLTDIALETETELLVVTPYLVPTLKMLEITETLIGRGVKISVLTNSLGTNDVPIAHAMYSHFRQRIIDMGVNLFEMRADAEIARDDGDREISLHSKYMIFDDNLVFIGSPNLDARSLHLNTELGVVLRSRSIADKLRATFHDLTRPENSWRVHSAPNGLTWESTAGTLDEEPAEGTWQRIRNWFFSLLPLHGQM